MSSSEVRRLQHALNKFTNKRPRLGHKELRIDGGMGRLTRRRIYEVKFDIGYSRDHLSVKVDENFYNRMRRPNHVEPRWGQTRDAVRRGQKRRLHRRISVRRNKLRAFLKPGVGSFDGVPVAKCAIPVLSWCRQNGWHGRLVSGWRDPKYSQGLCYRICGRPSCPGKCAGLASNHVGNSPARFAMDLSDYLTFGRVVARCPIRPHVHNSLPNDRVHFSPSGN